jgi:hypothetical protein
VNLGDIWQGSAWLGDARPLAVLMLAVLMWYYHPGMSVLCRTELMRHEQ